MVRKYIRRHQLITSCLCSLLAVCFFLSPLASAADSVSLERNWKFQPGDNPAWAEPNWDDSDWQTKELPETWPEGGYPEQGQFAWYRLRISVADFDQSDLGVRIGAIRNAYEVYAGGQHLGGIGAPPPDPVVNYDKLRAYRIPPAAIDANDDVVLALRVWGGSALSVNTRGAGPYAGKFELGNYTHFIRSLDAEELPRIIFASLFLLAGAYFLYLYIKTKEISSFLWFGLTSLVLAVYIVTQSQWKYTFGFAFETNEKIEAVSLFLFLALVAQLIWTVIARPVPFYMRAYQLFYVVFAVIFGLAPSLDIHLHLRVYWQSVVLIALVPTFWVLCQEVWRNNYEARVLCAGLIVFAICAINDLLINMGINTIVEVRLMSVGFLAMLISMGVSLAGRFNNMLTSLEIQVSARTAELSQVNDQLEAANRSLVEMTRIDPLTGLLNRRGLIAEAEIERQRFLRQKEPLSLVVADVDHFKQFNDEHGHACGDFVLTSVAGLFKKYIRDIDRVARWGGEEFVLLFPGTNEVGLRNIADKLRQRIENHEINYEGKTLSVTMTFGCAEYRTDESLDECLDRADAALYKGKANGRNRVEIG